MNQELIDFIVSEIKSTNKKIKEYKELKENQLSFYYEAMQIAYVNVLQKIRHMSKELNFYDLSPTNFSINNFRMKKDNPTIPQIK